MPPFRQLCPQAPQFRGSDESTTHEFEQAVVPLGHAPVPLSGIVMTVPGAALIVSVANRSPGIFGLKVTTTLQDLPGPKVVEQVVFVVSRANSLAFAPVS